MLTKKIAINKTFHLFRVCFIFCICLFVTFLAQTHRFYKPNYNVHMLSYKSKNLMSVCPSPLALHQVLPSRFW